jgi:hypothetical protein
MLMRHLLWLAWLALAALLGSCSSGGGGSSSPPGPSTMFWLDSGNLAIWSFSTAHPALGDTVPIDRAIFSTSLGSAAAAAVLDAAGDRLFVANGTEILVFDHASTADGNQAPRVIQSSAFVNVASLSLDASRNLLYVGDRNTGGVPSIYVIGNASTASGPVTPLSITDNSTEDRRFVFIDATNDVLYVADTCQVSVFTGASMLSGLSTPTHQFASCPALVSADHPLWLDAANDQLYVMNPLTSDPSVMVFASTSSAPTDLPSRTIRGFVLDPAAKLRNVFLDTNHNRLYVASTFSLYILEGASALNGTLTDADGQQRFGFEGQDLAAVAINTTP